MKRVVWSWAGATALTAAIAVGPMAIAMAGAAHAATATPITVAVEGSNGALWVQAPQLGSGWHSLGGKIIAPPAVAELRDPAGNWTGQPLFVAEGTDHHLWMRSLTAGWQPIGLQACESGPAVMVFTGTEITVACAGVYHALAENYTPYISATNGLPEFDFGWTNLGGVLSAAPALSPVDYNATFFVTGTGNRVYLSEGSPGQFTATRWLCIGQPAAAFSDTSDSATFFACQGTNHALWEASNARAAGQWTAAVSLGGQLIGGPAIAASSTGTEFFAVGTNHAVWERTLTGGWTSLGGYAVGGVGASALNY